MQDFESLVCLLVLTLEGFFVSAFWKVIIDMANFNTWTFIYDKSQKPCVHDAEADGCGQGLTFFSTKKITWSTLKFSH